MKEMLLQKLTKIKTTQDLIEIQEAVNKMLTDQEEKERQAAGILNFRTQLEEQAEEFGMTLAELVAFGQEPKKRKRRSPSGALLHPR